MINILQRGGIHRTKHEFGPFNRKYTKKRNKKRALIIQRGVYSEHSFSGLNSPSRGRHVKNTARHPFLARQGLKRAAWKWKRLGRLIGEQVTEMSEREGFVRRFLKAQPDTDKRQTTPRPVTPGPVPHFEVELVDDKFCFLDIVEPEMILELYADIVSRMPDGMIPQVGDYQSFDPWDKDGSTGSRVRMHNGKIVEVQQLATKWEGPYKPLVKIGRDKGWDIWRATPLFKTLSEEVRLLRAKTVTGIAAGPLKPGEAVICLPDGTFEAFLGRGATPHYGQPYEEDYVETLSIAFEVPKGFLDNESDRPSIGFIPKGKLTEGDIRGIKPRYDLPEWTLPPATPVPGRTIEHLAPGLNLITDTIQHPRKDESVNVTDTEEEVKMTNKRDILHIVLEDGLNLTVDQMSKLTKSFADFMRDPESNVVTTASGISLKIITVEEGQDIRSSSVVLDNETWNRVWEAKDIADLTVVTTHDSVTLTPEWPEGDECAPRIDSTERSDADDIEATLATLREEENQKDKL